MSEEVDIIFKKGEVCASKFSAQLLGKTPDQENDDGIVYITNKRLVFKGKKSLAISTPKILRSETTSSQLTLHMENGNVISFNTKHLLAPSVLAHINSIAEGKDAAAAAPLLDNPQWYSLQDWSPSKTGLRPPSIEHPHTKLKTRKRKSRQIKRTEDAIAAILALLLTGVLYFYFFN